MITLTEGGQFDERNLKSFIQDSGRQYIIQGQQTISRENHTKPLSLDYWLRQFATNPDTKQADNVILESLVDTGNFVIHENLQCPDSGNLCKGIILT